MPESQNTNKLIISRHRRLINIAILGIYWFKETEAEINQSMNTISFSSY